MNQEKVILTDCDGVVLDWELAFQEWMTEQGMTVKAPGVYDIGELYGITKAEGKAFVKKFNESAWVGFLPALRDARSGVAKLVEHGYTFVAITSLSLDKKAQMLRISNLKNLFGQNVFVDVVCLDTGADKDEELINYEGSGMFWIEDKTANAECGLKYGLTPILIAHEHNKEHAEGITRLNDWAEIADHIINS